MADETSASWPPRRVDALVVLACLVLGVANTWLKPSNGLLSGQPTATVATVSGLVAVFLWWRRSWPLTVALLIICCHVVAFTPIALAVALFTVGAAYYRSLRTLVGLGLAACLADLAALWAGNELDPRETGYSVALAIGPLVVGYAVAVRRALTASVRTQLATVEREQGLLVERARAGERARIAREMHDVVAHRVGHIVLWAGSLRLGAGATDPKVAETAEQIRGEGRQALAELREILGVLLPGRTREAAVRTARPDTAELPALVERARQFGQDVTLDIDGHPETLPAPVQRALFRIAQEALTNAAKHAPGAPVRIGVDCRIDRVDITVANSAATRPAVADLPGGGNGLIGLQERVALLDGEFTAGATDDGYRVSARIPHHGS